MESKYIPLHRPWFSGDFFVGIDRKQVLLKDEELNFYRDYFLGHLQAESDSKNLYQEIVRHHTVSPEFMDFLRVWRIEEQNHAEGYYLIMRILFDENESQLKQRVENEPASFNHLKDFLDDEFKLCVLFAYDEYATVMDYRKNSLGHKGWPITFAKWIDKVIKDEARHFVNLIKLIHYKYKARIHETPNILQQVLNVEKNLKDYQHTFLFDHTGSNFKLHYDELEHECANRVLKSIYHH